MTVCVWKRAVAALLFGYATWVESVGAEDKPAAKPAADAKPADAKKADAQSPGAKKPEPTKPEPTKPEPTKPGVKKPEAKKPEAKPSSAKPEPKRNPREYVSGKPWKEPKIIDPGPPGGPPADALVLFDGKNLTDEFVDAEEWTIADGIATVAGRKSIRTRKSFGSCQLHVEWATPEKVSGTGQGRGNSGVYLMERYEVQILDSYGNVTYFDGQAASIYKQKPPLVNASRGPGQWQTYDIIFHAPKFADDGKLQSPATVTVLHNGVLVQDHFELEGGTFFDRPPAYAKHGPKAPLSLQNHGNPMRFRNIWIRELAD